MSLVKEEYDSECESSYGDKWLSQWANPEEETIKEEEVDSKEALMEITDGTSAKDCLEKHVKQERMEVVENLKRFSSSKTRNKHYEESKDDSHEEHKETKTSKRAVKSKKMSNHSTHLAKIETLLEKAEVIDKVENLCKYQCPKCAAIFKSRTAIYQHFRSSKHADTSKRIINECLTDIVAHMCRICSKKILCDKTIIKNHLFNCHHLRSVKQYSNSQSQLAMGQDVYKYSLHLDKLKSMLEEAKVTDKVENRCKYQCPECAEIFRSRTTIHHHFKRTKHADASKRPINEFLTDVVAHECRVCSKKILCDRTVIRQHVLHNHNGNSVKEYNSSLSHFKMRHSLLNNARTTKIVANLCKYQCPKCDYTFESKLALRKHFQETKHAVSSKIVTDQCLVEVVGHKCHICSQKVLCDKDVIQNHLANHHKGTTLADYSENFSLTVRDSLLENAKISDSVENLCTYQCPKCEKVFKARSIFFKHLKQSKHALRLSTRSGDQVDRYLKDVIAHMCHICSIKILCEKSIIRQHMKIHHSMTMIKYCNKMNLELESQKSKINKDILQLVTQLSTKLQILKKIGNFCNFSCYKCDFVTNNYASMREHIRKNGHGPLLPYTRYLTSAIFYVCRLCDKLVPNDKDIFSVHISSQHKITLQTYRKRVKLPNFEEQGCQYISKLKTAIKDIPIVQPQTRRTLETNALSENQVTKNIGNLSFFKCPVCSKPNMNFAMLVNHCKKQHQHKKFIYDKKHVVEARYHRCFICAKIVLCDNAMISSHISGTHSGVAISTYIKDFVLKGGGKVFPTFRDYRQNNQIFEIIKE